MDVKGLNKMIFDLCCKDFNRQSLYVFYLIKLSGDIKKNHGSKLSSYQKLSIYYRDLNSIVAHDFIKVSLLITYNFFYTQIQ